MASQGQKQKLGRQPSDSGSLDLIEDIKKLVGEVEDKELLTYDELLFKLQRWWCKYYKRPYKDPLLETYTIEELLFEYFDITVERNKETEQSEPTELPQDEWDWAAEEEAKEKAALEAVKAVDADADAYDDMISEEGLSDEQWADKVLNNPTASQVDAEGGDISASFGE